MKSNIAMTAATSDALNVEHIQESKYLTEFRTELISPLSYSKDF
jgi:hypothetical protein